MGGTGSAHPARQQPARSAKSAKASYTCTWALLRLLVQGFLAMEDQTRVGAGLGRTALLGFTGVTSRASCPECLPQDQDYTTRNPEAARSPCDVLGAILQSYRAVSRS